LPKFALYQDSVAEYTTTFRILSSQREIDSDLMGQYSKWNREVPLALPVSQSARSKEIML
jgi:hypothetical protein